MFRDLVEVCFILRARQLPKAVAQGESCGDCAKHVKHPYIYHLIPLKGIVCVHIVETSTATC